MTAWNIHVAEVQQVLQNASSSADDYPSDEVKVTESLNELVMALPSSPHVAMRVQEFADEVIYPHLKKIFDDTAAALEGTTHALMAYQEGDMEMARNAQYAAAQAAHPAAPGSPGALFQVR